MRSALVALVLVLAALLACKKNGPLRLATTSGTTAPPADGGPSHTQINADTYSVECWGGSVDCVKDAATVCANGYDILASSDTSLLDGGVASAQLLGPADGGAASDAGTATADAATADAATEPVDAGAADATTGPDGAARFEIVVKCKAK